MLNRIVVNIDGYDYTVISEDPEEHIRKSAALVDQSIRDIKAATPLSTMSAAVLAAMNIADKYYRAQDAGDGLRRQIREYADENSKLRAELNRLRRG